MSIISNGHRAAMLAGVASLGLFLPAVAHAQDRVTTTPIQDGDEFPADEDLATGNEIVVTATKREQTLQEIPVAVSVTTAETLERAQIRDLGDLQTVVPSLRVDQLQSSANTNFIIRGFGNGANNAGIEPSVGVFVDGVYRSRTASQINDLPDVQRIEVLRGPQSTLFGKNASAGVISIVTREPQFTPEGALEVSYGNYNAVVVKGYATSPISDTFAVSLAAGVNAREGYLDDLNLNDESNERKRAFVRGQALWEPTSDLSLRLIADYDVIDEICCGVVNLRQSAATGAVRAVGGNVNDPNDPFADEIFTNFPSSNLIKNYGFSGQIDYDIGDFTLTSITAYRNTDALTNQDADFTSADLIGSKLDDIQLDTFTQELRLAGTIGDRIGVLIGGYYFDEKVDQNSNILFGEDFRPYANLLIQGATRGTQSIATLEPTLGALQGNPAQFIGQFFAEGDGLNENYTLDNTAYSVFGQIDFEIIDGLTLTLGGNYTVDEKDFTLNVDSTDVFSGIDLVAVGNTAIAQQGIATTVGTLLGLGRPATAAEIGAFAGANPAGFGQVQAGAQAFANANQANPAVNPLLSLRPLQFLPPFLNVPNSVEDGETDDNNFAYTVRLAYDVSPDLNIYASYATGFKASSINLSRDSRPLLADQAAIEAAGIDRPNQTYGTRFAGPEESKVMEFGAKLNLNRFSANLAVFDQTIEGFQSNTFTGTGFALTNAGEQSTFGVELETTFNPVDALTFTAGVTYLDPIFDSFLNSAFGDATGRTPAGIPEYTVQLGANYVADVGGGDNAIFNVGYLYASETQIIQGLPGFIVRNADGTRNFQPGFDAAAPFTREVNQLSASITYALENGIAVQFWGRNLLDDRYLTTIFDSVAQQGSISGYTNAPRTYGVSLRYKW